MRVWRTFLSFLEYECGVLTKRRYGAWSVACAKRFYQLEDWNGEYSRNRIMYGEPFWNLPRGPYLFGGTLD